ncbi:zinc finger BED domain-containing protein 5-like [Oratosquilla oratoria]|uniref:zinc finger BED domain-containing protein 5-like n=1 Tax=Oratosquilla oratoria TaxID=337810 RepID=UPI003F772BB7
MSGDIKEQVGAAINESGKFSLQLDKSSDVQYQGKSDIEEDFLFCKRMETTTTDEDLFKLVDSFIKEEGFRWDQCLSVCSDGAPAMLGTCQGFTASDSDSLWLSRGKVLQRVLDMHAEVEIFLNKRKHTLASKLSEPGGLLKLAYLSDIFSELNLLNMSMQGKDETLISVSEKLRVFKANIRLWNGKIEQGKTTSFPLLKLILEDEEDASLVGVQNVIGGHLEKLSEEFDRYIPDVDLHEKYKWMCRPFDVHAEDLSEEESSIHNLQEELIEVQNDETLHFNFQHQILGVFWTTVKIEKPVLGCETVKVFLPFATTYLYESGFAALTAIKAKHRSRL